MEASSKSALGMPAMAREFARLREGMAKRTLTPAELGGGTFTIDTANSNLSGSGNTAMPFSSNDGGGNTGTIQFNGGADTAP